MKWSLLLTVPLLMLAFAAEAKDEKKKTKVKKPQSEVEQVVTAPAPAPAPKPAIDAYTQSQIDKALARTAPIGVTTYGAMAAAVAAGQNGGDPIAAAEAASAGW